MTAISWFGWWDWIGMPTPQLHINYKLVYGSNSGDLLVVWSTTILA